ncbi:Dynactin subunit 4 [Paramecium bursaria]
MYSFTKQLISPVFIQCECGRDFLQEEMYCCLACQISMCRFCTQNDVSLLICRNCHEITQWNDQSFITTCQNCYECPVCKSVLKKQIDQDKVISFYCSFCFYSTKSIDCQDVGIQQLTQKLNQLQKNETENKQYPMWYQSLKDSEAKVIQLKKQKQQKMFLAKVKNSSRSERIRNYSQQEIEINQQQREKQIIFDRYNLQVKESQLNLKDYEYKMAKKPLLIPQHVQLFSKKTRKCKKCQKMIVQIQLDKNERGTKKLVMSISYFHYDYTPFITLQKIKYTNKDKSEAKIMILIQNLTKNQFDCQLLPLQQNILEAFKLVKMNNLPSPIFGFKDINEMESAKGDQLKNQHEFDGVVSVPKDCYHKAKQ